MKRLGLILAILAVVTAAEIRGLAWTKEYSAALSDRLTALSEAQDPLPALDDLAEEWEQNRRLMSLFLHERPLDSFEDRLASARSHASAGTDPSALLLEAAEAARHIWQNERPSPQNVL